MSIVTTEAQVAAAIAYQQPVLFKYRDAEGVTSYRVASPHRLTRTSAQNGHNGGGRPFTVLEAYDHGREDFRHFRLSRIEGDVQTTDAVSYERS